METDQRELYTAENSKLLGTLHHCGGGRGGGRMRAMTQSAAMCATCQALHISFIGGVSVHAYVHMYSLPSVCTLHMWLE